MADAQRARYAGGGGGEFEWEGRQGCAASCRAHERMNRVKQLFKRLRAEKRCGLVAYVTCGDGPTTDIILALEDAGADCIELGVPFSDPIADGPVIQAAAQRALQRGTP